MPDNRPIYQSQPFRIKKLEYVGHACIIQSYADGLDVVARISLDCYSAQCSPYAMRLDDEEGIREVYEDHGEFTAGGTLASCLKSFEKKYSGVNGANILLVVTRKVFGCFVADMVQHQKFNAIRTCGMNALRKMNKHVIPSGAGIEPVDKTTASDTMTSELPPESNKSEMKRPSYKPAAVTFDPDSFGLPPLPDTTAKAYKRERRSGHFMDK